MDGILVVNKHKEVTSHDIVYKTKKILNEKVGHTGTLDPMAEGVLPLLVGKGTNCSKYLMNHDKKYLATVKLGIKMDSADIEGNIIEEKDVDLKMLDDENVKKVLANILGKQQQTPPMYSAIKVNGKKLYEYARKGEVVDVKSREIEIYETNLVGIDKDNMEVEFEVKVSKGTYIRTVCENIAEKLGTVGYMLKLKRLEVGEFNIQDSITLKELEENKEKKEYIENHFISIEKFFCDKPKIELEERKLEHFLNGVRLTNKNPDGIYRIYFNSEFLGLGIIKDNLLKRDVIIESE